MGVILPAWARSRDADRDGFGGSPIEEFHMYNIGLQRYFCVYKMCLRLRVSAGGCFISGIVDGDVSGLALGPSRLVISHRFGLVSLLQIKWKNFKNFLRLI